jgi:hypothetical protein
VALVTTNVSVEHIAYIFKVNDTLESSQLVARICLTTGGKESLLHGTPQSKLIRYRGAADCPYFVASP